MSYRTRIPQTSLVLYLRTVRVSAVVLVLVLPACVWVLKSAPASTTLSVALILAIYAQFTLGSQLKKAKRIPKSTSSRRNQILLFAGTLGFAWVTPGKRGEHPKIGERGAMTCSYSMVKHHGLLHQLR